MGISRKRRRRDGSDALLEVGVYRVRGGADEPLAGIRVVRTSDEALVAVALVAVDGQLTESDGGCEDGRCEDGRCFGLRGRRFVASCRGSIEEVGRDARWDLVGDFDAALYFCAGRDEAAFAACVRARGVAVLRGALSPEDVRAATDGCWSWIERASRWRRRDPASWADPRGDFSERHGVVFVGGQCEGSWVARSAPGVLRAFAAIWDGDEDLIASMEPLIVWRPWRTPKDAKRTRGGWLHYDDDEAAYAGRCPVQGLVSLTPSSAATGGFVAVPDSHSSEDLERPTWRYAALGPGDLVAWDSRTLHASEPGCDASAYDRADLLRLACPVCLVPRAAATPDALADRVRVHEAGGTTTHRPHRPEMRFAEDLEPPAPPPTLAPRMRRVL